MKSANRARYRFPAAVVMAVLAVALYRCANNPPVPSTTPTPLAVTEFPLMPPDSHPMGIVRGPDNNLWFTETSANRIGRRAADGTVSGFDLPHAGSAPAAIAVGPDGKLWFTEMDGGRVGTITTDGATIGEFTLPTGHEPADLTLGPDGFIWFTDIVPLGDQVGRITPGGSTSETGTPTVTAMPAGMVKARDGSLYFLETSADKIARIAARGSVFAAPGLAASAVAGSIFTEYPIPTAGAGLAAITLGSDGNLWFTENRTDKIGKLDVATGVVSEFKLPTANASASGIVGGPDCNVWFVENNSGFVGRVTTAGVITEFKPSAGSDPTDITVGADGSLWYTESDPSKLATFAVQSQACADTNLPPVAKCQDTTVNTDSGACSAASASINNGSFDPNNNLASTLQVPASKFSLGKTPAILTLTDSDGAVSSCEAQGS